MLCKQHGARQAHLHCDHDNLSPKLFDVPANAGVDPGAFNFRSVSRPHSEALTRPGKPFHPLPKTGEGKTFFRTLSQARNERHWTRAGRGPSK
jgi:hypothetical protein